MKRSIKKERRLLGEIKEVIDELRRNFPRNPADTKLIFRYAVQSRRIHPKISSALSTLEAGPHADCDYIECATEDVCDAMELARDLTALNDADEKEA